MAEEEEPVFNVEEVEDGVQLPPDPLRQCLIWIGFHQQNAARIEEEIGSLSDVSSLTHKDVSDLGKSFATRTQNEGRFYFGINRTKKMKALTDWAEDFGRINKEPTTVGMDREGFLADIETSRQRAAIRRSDTEKAEAHAKEASPGKLTSEREWDKWESKFENQLSIMHGVRGVPLLYVIREDEEPSAEATFETFIEESIAKCPLEGPKFEADSKTVHQMVVSNTTGENSEQWIRPLKKHSCGRRDMQALRAHYRGEGNQSRRVTDAEKLRDTVHYRSERAMPFQNFLTKSQRMFNLFEQVGEPYTEPAKLRFLLEKTQSTELATTVAAIRAAISLNQEAYSFTSAANHLSAQIGTSTNSSARTVSAVNSTIMRDGKVHTGYYSSKQWNELSPDDKAAVTAERAKQGIGKKKGKNHGNALKAKVAALEKKLSTQKSTIASLKRTNEEDGTEGGSESDEATNPGGNPANTAGNSFGGRSEKAKANKKAKK